MSSLMSSPIQADVDNTMADVCLPQEGHAEIPASEFSQISENFHLTQTCRSCSDFQEPYCATTHPQPIIYGANEPPLLPRHSTTCTGTVPIFNHDIIISVHSELFFGHIGIPRSHGRMPVSRLSCSANFWLHDDPLQVQIKTGSCLQFQAYPFFDNYGLSDVLFRAENLGPPHFTTSSGAVPSDNHMIFSNFVNYDDDVCFLFDLSRTAADFHFSQPCHEDTTPLLVDYDDAEDILYYHRFCSAIFWPSDSLYVRTMQGSQLLLTVSTFTGATQLCASSFDTMMQDPQHLSISRGAVPASNQVLSNISRIGENNLCLLFDYGHTDTGYSELPSSLGDFWLGDSLHSRTDLALRLQVWPADLSSLGRSRPRWLPYLPQLRCKTDSTLPRDMFDGWTSAVQIHQDPRHFTTDSGAIPRYQPLCQDAVQDLGYFDLLELHQWIPFIHISATVQCDQALQPFTTCRGAVPSNNHSLIGLVSNRSLQSLQSRAALGHVFLDSFPMAVAPSQSTSVWLHNLPLVQNPFESLQVCHRTSLWNLLHFLFPSHAPDIVEKLCSTNRQEQKVYCNSPLRGSVQQLLSPGHRNTDVVTPDALPLISQPDRFENLDSLTSSDSCTSTPAPLRGWSTAIYRGRHPAWGQCEVVHMAPNPPFAERCAAAMQDNGWLASDEALWCMRKLRDWRSDISIGPMIQWSPSRDLRRLMSSEDQLQCANHRLTLLLFLVDAHWCAVEVDRRTETVHVVMIQWPPELHTTVTLEVSRILQIPPHRLLVTYDFTNEVIAMCGWIILFRWYVNFAMQTCLQPFIHVIAQHQVHFDRVIHRAQQQWRQTNATEPVRQFASECRQAFMSEYARDQPDTRLPADVSTTMFVGPKPEYVQEVCQLPRPPTNREQEIQWLRTMLIQPAWLTNFEVELTLRSVRLQALDRFLPGPLHFDTHSEVLEF